jgi:hypothetical protein
MQQAAWQERVQVRREGALQRSSYLLMGAHGTVNLASSKGSEIM